MAHQAGRNEASSASQGSPARSRRHQSDCIEAALGYAGRGWFVTPTSGKTPVLQDWPKVRLDESGVRRCFTSGHNVGVILGASGLADLDFDEPVAVGALRALAPPELEGAAAFAHAGRPHLIVRSSGVDTRRFKRPDGTTILEVRGEGAQTVFPPSVHPDGAPYVWVKEREPCEVEAGRLRTLAAIIATVAYVSEHWREGSRHDLALALVGFLARRLDDDEVLSIVRGVATVAGDVEMRDREAAVASTAKRVKAGEPVVGLPTLEAVNADLARTLASWWGGDMATSDEDEEVQGKVSQADVLVSIGRTTELFHDSSGTAYTILSVDGHREVWPLQSKRFKNWLRRGHYVQYRKVPNSESVTSACGVLDGLALFDGPERETHNRVAWCDDAIYYDLADRHWRGVRVGREGWEIVRDAPVLFRRHQHQHPQVEPARGGDPREVLRFLNVREDDELLLLVWLVAAFVPDIPHPIPDFHGEKGSGKSMGQRVLRRLIDPSSIESLALSGDARELVQQLSHHYAPVYDNVDGLAPWVSDILCRAVTGEGFSKRELYSDDEDVIYSYRRVLMLNGVNVVPRRPDLLDRSILIALDRISRGKRQEEREFWKRFEEARPRILGGIFDVLSGGMRVHAEIEIPALERMADFTRWGAAIAEALGYGFPVFLQAYESNLAVQSREAVEGHIVGAAVLALMQDRGEWSGSPTDLLRALEEAGKEGRLLKRTASGKIETKGWPGAPHILSRRLNEVRGNLTDLGLEVELGRGDGRIVTIRKMVSEGRKASDRSDGSDGTYWGPDVQDDAADATDATFPLLEYKRWETGEPCYACGRVAWRQRADGEWVCGVCHPDPVLLAKHGRDGSQSE